MEGERERGTGERGGRKGERGRREGGKDGWREGEREGGRVREAGSKAPKQKLSDISNTLLTRGTQPTASVWSAGESCGTAPAGRHTAATMLRATTSSLSNLSSEQSNMLDK